jgi:hypothetical protein
MCAITAAEAGASDVQVAVMQAMAGMIRAMHARRLLWPQTRDRDGLDLWQRTFSVAQASSPS